MQPKLRSESAVASTAVFTHLYDILRSKNSRLSQ